MLPLPPAPDFPPLYQADVQSPFSPAVILLLPSHNPSKAALPVPESPAAPSSSSRPYPYCIHRQSYPFSTVSAHSLNLWTFFAKPPSPQNPYFPSLPVCVHYIPELSKKRYPLFGYRFPCPPPNSILPYRKCHLSHRSLSAQVPGHRKK